MTVKLVVSCQPDDAKRLLQSFDAGKLKELGILSVEELQRSTGWVKHGLDSFRVVVDIEGRERE